MANKTIEARGSKNHHTFRLFVEEQTLTDADKEANRSRVYYKLSLIDTGYWYWSGWGTQISYSLNIGGNSVSGYIPDHNSPDQTIASGTVNVGHEDDGTKTMSFSFSISDTTGQSYTCGSASGSSTLALTTIPRGFSSQPTISSPNLQETTLELAWGTSETANQLEIYLDDTLVETKTVNGKSGTFTVTGTAGSGPHNVYYWARRSDTNVKTKSEIFSNWSFYDYPHITNVGSNPLIIGNEQNLTLYNPLGRTITIKMYKNNTSGTQLYSATTSLTGNSVSYKFTPNSATLYNSIPTSKNANCVYSVIGTTTRTTNTKTYQIKGDEFPTFETNYWSYSANLTALTNNNQVVIDKYATITTSINTQATSDYGATMDKYIIEWGTASSDTSSVTNGSGGILKVTAYDKRTLGKETSKEITNIPYTDIKITSASTPRTNGVEAGVKLNVNGTFYNTTFGSSGVQNALYSAKYYTSTDGTTWSNGYTIPTSSFTTSGNYFNLSNYTIHANGSSGGFTVGTKYYVKVEIKDAQGLLATATYISDITDGTVARDTFKDSNGYHLGINGLADSNYAMKVYGKINATTGIYKNGTEITPITYGTTAGTACEGNDSRLSDSRTPKAHASTATTYGVGSTSNYGHCKTINNLTTSSYSDGTALSAYQGYILSERNTYSTSEKAIGKWTDGKTLYRRVVTGSRSGSAETGISYSSWNVSTLVKVTVQCYNSNGQYFYPAPYYNSSSDNYRVYVNTNNKNIYMNCGNSYPGYSGNYVLIVEYTKTS